MALRLEGYVKSSDGFGDGTYEVLHPKGASIGIDRSLFEGDILKISSVRNTPDPALEKARGIRFYDGNKKLFDGYLRAPDYRRGSNKNRILTTKIYDWGKELEAIYITEAPDGTKSYTNQSIDSILQDLCRIANWAGVVKKQVYKYDPSKLPYHPLFFTTELISPTFTNTLWSAFSGLTKEMDVLETSRTGQWVIKVDSLQDDNYIYIIPQMVSIDSVSFGEYQVGSGFTNQSTHPYGLMLWAKTLTNITSSNLTLSITYTDQGGANPNTATITIPKDTLSNVYFPIPLEPGDTLVKDVTNITGTGGGAGNAVRIEGKGTRNLPDWKLQPPKEIGKDYRNLLNHVIVDGRSQKTQTIGTTPLLNTTNITSNDFYINPTIQPTKRNYLQVSISNPTAGDKTGSVKLRGFSGLPEGPDELLEERFYLKVPAGQIMYHASDNRYYSLSMNTSPNTGLNITGFSGCTVKVEEFMYGVAGRSINQFGLRADTIHDVGFNTQLKCDSYANNLVQSYHAPVVYVSVVVKPKYIETSDLVGKTVRMEDDLTGTQMDFLCTKQVLSFSGVERREQIEATRFNYDWEYIE